jgi:hypothetical protein
MSTMMRTLFALALACGLAFPALADHPNLQAFPTAEAAADTLTEALRKDDDKTISAILGMGWRDFVPGTKDEEDKVRTDFLAAWDKNHKLIPEGDSKMLVEVGTTGFTMPIPIVKEGAGWRFDIEAGLAEMTARRIGRNELHAIQTLLAIVDAQFDYSVMDPMKTGRTDYARRLLSSPGRKDGLYWDAKPGEPESPLGPLVAKAQPGDGEAQGYYGYHYRLLYGQGPAAQGGAYSYLVQGRMLGGFGVIAWPTTYGETGVSTFIVNQTGEVYERDFGPDTSQKVSTINIYDPDKEWQKADTTPP